MGDPAMETAEFGGKDFKDYLKHSLDTLGRGQEAQGKRITDMHVRQDGLTLLLQGPLGKPQDGLVSKVQDNEEEIGYLKKSKDRIRSIWTAIFVSVAGAIILAMAAAVFKFGM